MMLTAIPPTLLHRVRDAAAYVHDLAQLGLDQLCPCDEGHGERLRQLEAAPIPEREEDAAAECARVCLTPEAGDDECSACPWERWLRERGHGCSAMTVDLTIVARAQ